MRRTTESQVGIRANAQFYSIHSRARLEMRMSTLNHSTEEPMPIGHLRVCVRSFVIIALTALFAIMPVAGTAQAPLSAHAACVAAANRAEPAQVSTARRQCDSDRAAARAALKQALAKAGIDLAPDAQMIDQYQRTGTWDLMRALRLAHGKRNATKPLTP
jgi:hypothetical protein